MSSLSIVTEGAGRYVHWGVIQISLTNILILTAMAVIFALAILVPFGSRRGRQADRKRRR